MRNLVLTFFAVLSFLSQSEAQVLNIAIRPIETQILPGIQSYAWAQRGNKVVIIGGRIDGLHRRQPFAAFDLAGHNTDIIVLEPSTGNVWSASTENLDAALKEHLRSTNFQYCQDGNYLLLTGGYGYSDLQADHITFPFVTKVELDGLIAAVIQGSVSNSFFTQITDERFAITGGDMEKIGSRWMLVGGHRFDGRYNPMNGPSFTQVYTNAMQQFDLDITQSNLSISNFVTITDTTLFHRRDYNLVPQVFPDGNEGMTIYSGVFRTDLDLPYINAVSIKVDSHYEEPSFMQYLNHYHCAVMPVWSGSTQTQHSIFFGGMAQYYPDSSGTIVQDNNVPFVQTITDVIRDANGNLTENRLNITMPGFLGASAEFIPAETITTTASGVLLMDEISGDSTVVGYIFGGIRSDAPNIFWVNDGSQSIASPVLYEVVLIQDASTGTADFVENKQNMRAYPCPMNDHVFVEINLVEKSDVVIQMFNPEGKEVYSKKLKNQPAGAFEEELHFKKGLPGGMYLITSETKSGIETMRILVTE
jgi:hypothetical protein